MYSVGDDTKRWLNTEDRNGIKSPVTSNLQESPMRVSSGGAHSYTGQAMMGGGGPPGNYHRRPAGGNTSIPLSGTTTSRMVGVGNASGDATL